MYLSLIRLFVLSKAVAYDPATARTLKKYKGQPKGLSAEMATTTHKSKGDKRLNGSGADVTTGAGQSGGTSKGKEAPHKKAKGCKSKNKKEKKDKGKPKRTKNGVETPLLIECPENQETMRPTQSPTTSTPTVGPTYKPTFQPSARPTIQPTTHMPTKTPTTSTPTYATLSQSKSKKKKSKKGKSKKKGNGSRWYPLDRSSTFGDNDVKTWFDAVSDDATVLGTTLAHESPVPTGIWTGEENALVAAPTGTPLLQTNVPTQYLTPSPSTSSPISSEAPATRSPSAPPTNQSFAPKELTSAPLPKPSFSPISPSPISFPATSLQTSTEQSYSANTRVAVPSFHIGFSVASSAKSISVDHIDQATELTLSYLNDYFDNTFSMVEAVVYKNMVGTRTGFSEDLKTVEFIAAAEFGSSSAFIPSPADFDTLVRTAFTQPASQTFLIMLSNLQLNNPFSETTSVTYASGRLSTSGLQAEGDRFQSNAGTLVGAFLVTFLLTGFMAAYKCKLGWSKATRKPVSGRDWPTSRNSSHSDVEEMNLYGDDEKEEITIEFTPATTIAQTKETRRIGKFQEEHDSLFSNDALGGESIMECSSTSSYVYTSSSFEDNSMDSSGSEDAASRRSDKRDNV